MTSESQESSRWPLSATRGLNVVGRYAGWSSSNPFENWLDQAPELAFEEAEARAGLAVEHFLATMARSADETLSEEDKAGLAAGPVPDKRDRERARQRMVEVAVGLLARHFVLTPPSSVVQPGGSKAAGIRPA
jgi:hypothetical protein